MAAVSVSVPLALPVPSRTEARSLARSAERPSTCPAERPQPLEFAGVFKGRELTRKDRRLASGLAPLDTILDGGVARGRISEIVGPASSGKTAIAAAFAAAASRRGEVAAWLDLPGAFDPASVEAAGADLNRILWASLGGRTGRIRSPLACDARPSAAFDPDGAELARHEPNFARRRRRAASPWNSALKAAEMVLEAGGFGLVVIDLGAMRYALAESAALRLSRAAERSGVAVLVIAERRMCGTFAALTLSLGRLGARFSRLAPGAPALFDGLALEARVTRNKLGVFGYRAELDALADPLSESPLRPASGDGQSRPIPRREIR